MKSSKPPRESKQEQPQLKVQIDQVIHNSLATALPEFLDSLGDADLDRLDRAIDRQLRLMKLDKA